MENTKSPIGVYLRIDSDFYTSDISNRGIQVICCARQREPECGEKTKEKLASIKIILGVKSSMRHSSYIIFS